MSVRRWLDETGAAEQAYWHAYLRIADERRFREMEAFGMAGL